MDMIFYEEQIEYRIFEMEKLFLTPLDIDHNLAMLKLIVRTIQK